MGVCVCVCGRAPLPRHVKVLAGIWIYESPKVLSDVEARRETIVRCCRLPESLAAGPPQANAALAEGVNE